ncbi:hypothetical protein LIER_22962 [Lithospermum erythrorhizon]|uniref:Uncharacterized protein n=1 Tax=Lithospermum erythrorhizon TaxID=34254 RepID=A0AAV3R1F5_LITER
MIGAWRVNSELVTIVVWRVEILRCEMGRGTLGLGFGRSSMAFPLANEESQLNSSLYDERVYKRECPYSRLANLEPHSESLEIHFSSTSFGDDTSPSANSPISEMTVGDIVASKFMSYNDDVRAICPYKRLSPFSLILYSEVPFPLKDKMSQSSKNQVDNFELRPRTEADQAEASISGGMLIIPLAEPLAQVPLPQNTEPANPILHANVVEATRAEEAYQGMMASVPTFVKESTPPDLTDDQLDNITTYFSIPLEKVDTHLALPRESLYLPHIEESSTDPDLTFGYTSVYIETFSFGMRLPFSFGMRIPFSPNRHKPSPGPITPY